MSGPNSPGIGDLTNVDHPPIPVWKIWGIPIHRRMRTGSPHAAWDSVFILCLVWFTWGFNLFAGGLALTFTIQHYNHDPRVIALVGTFSAILMIGPVISYFSDSVWTRVGRRRPFLMVAWLGGIMGMFSLAFFAQLSGAINHTLGLVGLGPIGEIFILAGIVFCYQKMWDFAGPLEPFFLECVPPHQRGRFFAIRGILFTLAVMFFFQILWPVYDEQVDMLAPMGYPNLLILKGERVIYLLAGSLFTMTGFYLFFCTEEVRVPNAPNKSFREILLGQEAVPGAAPLPALAAGWKGFLERLNRIPIVTFVVGFFKSVIATPTNYPFYIILIIPGMEQSIWGNFGALMQNDQFGYSKPNQALYALPMGFLTMCVMTPFAGWYSDIRINLKWRYRILLLAISAVCVAATVRLCTMYAPSDPRELPALWVMFAITFLLGSGLLALFVPMTETLLDWVGHEHARAWISVVTVIKKIVLVATLYTVIRLSPHHVPSIVLWMVFFVANSALDALMSTFIAPMIYDYMSRNILGTIGAGYGLYNNFVTIFMANVGAWWVVFYTTHFIGPVSPGSKDYDYTSLYLLQFFLLIPAVIAKSWFVWLIVRGKLKKVGQMEVEGA